MPVFARASYLALPILYAAGGYLVTSAAAQNREPVTTFETEAELKAAVLAFIEQRNGEEAATHIKDKVLNHPLVCFIPADGNEPPKIYQRKGAFPYLVKRAETAMRIAKGLINYNAGRLHMPNGNILPGDVACTYEKPFWEKKKDEVEGDYNGTGDFSRIMRHADEMVQADTFYHENSHHVFAALLADLLKDITTTNDDDNAISWIDEAHTRTNTFFAFYFDQLFAAKDIEKVAIKKYLNTFDFYAKQSDLVFFLKEIFYGGDALERQMRQTGQFPPLVQRLLLISFLDDVISERDARNVNTALEEKQFEPLWRKLGFPYGNDMTGLFRYMQEQAVKLPKTKKTKNLPKKGISKKSKPEPQYINPILDVVGVFSLLSGDSPCIGTAPSALREFIKIQNKSPKNLELFRTPFVADTLHLAADFTLKKIRGDASMAPDLKEDLVQLVGVARGVLLEGKKVDPASFGPLRGIAPAPKDCFVGFGYGD